MDVGTLPDLDRLDNEALKALVVEQREQVEHLKLIVEKFRRMIFGAKSEKAVIQVEQFELQLEETETEQAAAEEDSEAPALEAEPVLKSRPSRKPLPAHLPREIVTHHPKQDCCPDCGGSLRNFGEDVAEILEYIPANFKVIRHVRPKFACKKCERVVEAPAPSRTIERGLAGPGLLAHVLVAKYADHCPLFRQSEIYAREGVDLDRSTLAGWVGAASELLTPLVDALRKHVLSAAKIHADDTPVPVLAPGNGKTKTGRLWTYVRDERAAGESTAPAVWFAYSPDRKGEHPRQHLKNFKGALQADAYSGFHHLYEGALFMKWRVGPMPGASSTTFMWSTPRLSLQKPLVASALCTASKKRCVANQRNCAVRFARPVQSRCSTICEHGWKDAYGNYPQKVRPLARSAMRLRTGERSHAMLTMGCWRLITRPPNGRYAP
jgi:transposase